VVIARFLFIKVTQKTVDECSISVDAARSIDRRIPPILCFIGRRMRERLLNIWPLKYKLL
jgi:hypothetical protein